MAGSVGLPASAERSNASVFGVDTESRNRSEQERSDRDRRSGILVVVPTYNERDNVPDLLREIFAVDERFHLGLAVLIVDDSSPDGTAAVARTEAQRYPGRVRVLERTGPRGLALSVLEGIEHASEGVLVVMDADLSHPPELIPTLVDPILRREADIVVGSRYLDGAEIDERWGLRRRLKSRVASLLAAPLTALSDPMSGYFALSRAALPDPRVLNPLGYKVLLEIVSKSDSARVRELPIRFRDRARGESKLGMREEARYLRHLVRLYDYTSPRWWRCAKCAGVGVSGVIVDLVVLAGLVGWAAIPFAAARAISVLAVMFSWFLWKRALRSSRERSTPREYCGLGFGTLVALAASWTTSVSLYRSLYWFQDHYLVAGILGAVVGTAVHVGLEGKIRLEGGGYGRKRGREAQQEVA